MSTLRRTRALRAPDLAAYRSWLVDLVRALPSQLAPDTFVLVPTRAAAEQLRRTVRESVDEPIAWPHIGTRGELMEMVVGPDNYLLVTIPPNVWHQAVVPSQDWAVVSFHTCLASDLIEERPDADIEELTHQRRYLHP